jgi:tetratricopeptide (TPR) repeat protein
MPAWFPYVDLACVAIAGGLWYAFAEIGPWPLILALAPWALRLVRVGRPTRRTPFDLPLLLFLLTAGVGVWAAYDRQPAWSKFWLIVGGVLLYYALVNAEPIADARAWLLAFFGAGVALYFLATHDWDAYPAKIDALTHLGRALQSPLPALPGHRLHPNVAGGIMAMMLPFAAWAAAAAWRGVWRAPSQAAPSRWLALAAGLGSVGLTLFGVVMSTSRGAWVALAGALLLAGLWTVSGWLSRNGAARRSWIFPALLLLALLVALGIGVAWPGGLVAILEILPGPDVGTGRVELLRNTLTLVRDYPFIGGGLGSFQMLYSTYVLMTHVGFSVHSHNLYLNVSVELGLLALLALIWMGILFAAAAWRGLMGPVTRLERGALGAAMLSLAVILIHGLADDVLFGSRAVLLLFVPLAFAVPFFPRRQRPVRRWVALALPLGVVLVLALALVWQSSLLSLIYSNLGAVHQSQTELAVYTWPEWPIQDAVRREVDLDQPVAEFERALELQPGNVTANRRLGMIELSMGDYEDALGHLEAAHVAEPWNDINRRLLGEALIVNGRLQEGAALWAGVSNEQRQLEARAYWYEQIGDAERAAWIRQAIADR